MYIHSVSPSRIKTFDHCLYKYFLNYHSKETLKTNWGAVHGSLLHAILEKYVLDEDKDYVKCLYKGYRGELEVDKFGKPTVPESPLKWAKPKDFANKKPYCDSCPFKKGSKCSISNESLDNLSGCPRYLFEGSVDMLDGVIQQYEKEIWPLVLRDESGEAVGVEYEFMVPIPGTDVLFRGFADLVVERDSETIEIIDYKSGVHTQDESECRDDVQVRGYAWAAHQEFVEDVNNRGYNYKYVVLTFDYFQGKPITTVFSEAMRNRIQDELMYKVFEIQNATKIRRVTNNPDREFKCKYLCDLAVCKKTWGGPFEVDRDHGKKT
jgi:hypothetical protein